jgi:hypothetical protein
MADDDWTSDGKMVPHGYPVERKIAGEVKRLRAENDHLREELRKGQEAWRADAQSLEWTLAAQHRESERLCTERDDWKRTANLWKEDHEEFVRQTHEERNRWKASCEELVEAAREVLERPSPEAADRLRATVDA